MTTSPPPMPRDSHVLISAGRLGVGGVMTHLRLLCLTLVRAGARATIYASGSEWSAAQMDELRAVGVRFRLPPRWLWAWPRLSGAYSALTWRFQLPRRASSLYCIGAGRSHLHLHALCSPGVVSVYHEVVSPPARQSPAGRCIDVLDVAVANSTAVAATMAAEWPAKPLRVIPFLTPPITPAGPRPAKVGDDLRVVYLGRLVAQKRPDRLAREWPVIRVAADLGASARLDVYGVDPEGSMLATMRADVARLGPEGGVVLHGPYEMAELPDILARADLVVLPSEWEGLPLVLVEAMRAGVPFVACAAGGTAELAVDNPDVIVTSTDWGDFVDGLKRMGTMIRSGAVDPARLADWAERRYGPERIGQVWVDALLNPRAFFGLDATPAPRRP